MTVRTRFAPSPTGFLHIGGARTALFSWAYARRHGGKFILRIEDTDLERSTRESVQAILDGLEWLGIDWDEGPFFQMKRLARYADAADQLIARGHAYRCYMTREELEELRRQQVARGEKPRYDGRWRPENGLKPPKDGKFVVRFKTPEAGSVGWDDLVKGRIDFPNAELDDLVLLRADGVPTYNFGVVVDDIDMEMSHVIRGDDHVNNTPRQIHIYNALGMTLPYFAHVPMILGADGERLSKRHGATNVTEYREAGVLPEALVNYLARLGWSHGDEELFQKEQFVEWFDLPHVSQSPARFDPEKLAWMNQQYIKAAPDARLASLTGLPEPVVALLKERAASLPQLQEEASIFTHYEVKPVDFDRKAFAALHGLLHQVAWERASIGAAIRQVAKDSGLKMPAIAMPLRKMVTGREQTPSIDAVLELLGREKVLGRIAHFLEGST
jgi:glutamyl-tRNA synthetase